VPGYLTKTETIIVGGVDTIIRSLLDRQQFSDPYGDAQRCGISSANWPLFGLVWPSALVLAAHMQHVALGQRQVLEVGCGLALASLVAHRRNGFVTASDHHPLTEPFLIENVLLNGLAPLRYQRGDWATSNPSLGRFDLIIGSDVLYDRAQPEQLAAFIELHAHAKMEVIIVDPDRGNRPAFNRGMDDLGYTRSETKITALPGSGLPYKGRVLSYRRGDGSDNSD
jgi:2-polyprenyl-3-methyl-5-hydroxy-6-metoxy-1,4-benzoquinol methylase